METNTFNIGDRVYYKYRQSRYTSKIKVGVDTIIDILLKEESVSEDKVLKYFNVDKEDRQFKYFLRPIKSDRLVIQEDNRKSKPTILPLSSDNSKFDIEVQKIILNELIPIEIITDTYFKSYNFKLSFLDGYSTNYDTAFVLNNIEILKLKSESTSKFYPFYVFYKDEDLRMAYHLGDSLNLVTVSILSEEEVFAYDNIQVESNYEHGYSQRRVFNINICDKKLIDFLDKYFLIQNLKK